MHETNGVKLIRNGNGPIILLGANRYTSFVSGPSLELLVPPNTRMDPLCVTAAWPTKLLGVPGESRCVDTFLHESRSV